MLCFAHQLAEAQEAVFVLYLRLQTVHFTNNACNRSPARCKQCGDVMADY